MKNEKMVIISTMGIDDDEKATLPFVLGVAAQTVDIDVVFFLEII